MSSSCLVPVASTTLRSRLERCAQAWRPLLDLLDEGVVRQCVSCCRREFRVQGLLFPKTVYAKIPIRNLRSPLMISSTLPASLRFDTAATPRAGPLCTVKTRSGLPSLPVDSAVSIHMYLSLNLPIHHAVHPRQERRACRH